MTLSKQELIDKKKELDLQIAKLLEFTVVSPTFKALPDEGKNKWRKQLSTMGDMSKQLGDSIAALENTAAE